MANNPEIQQALQEYRAALESNPTSSQPLDVLIKVEQKIIRSLREEVTKKVDEVLKAEIDEVLKEHSEKSISELLDETHEKAQEVLQGRENGSIESLEQYLERLNIVCRKVDEVILEPMDLELQEGPDPFERKELIHDKLQLLLILLRGQEIYTDDICIVIGENRPEMMREDSYLLIEIPKVERTIFLHLGYGEATFVIKGIHNRQIVIKMTKEEIVEKLGAIKIIYNEENLGKWMDYMLLALDLENTQEVTRVDIEEFERAQFYRTEIMKKCPTPEDFMGMSRKEKIGFKILGKGLKALSTYVGMKESFYPADSKKNLAKLGRVIYGEGHEVIECEFWSEEEWIERIKQEVPTAEEFIGIKQKDRVKFKILGKGLALLNKCVGIKENLNPVPNRRDMVKMARVIYGEGHEVIECEFWNEEEWVERIKQEIPTPEEFMGIKYGEKHRFKVIRRGLRALSTNIGIKENIDPIGYRQDMAKMARVIYGEGHEVIESVLREAETE